MGKDTGGQRSWRGWQVCGCVQSSIEDIIEPRLREAGHLGASEKVAIFQGCYNAGGVAASAGTHDGGGALDHAKGNDAETIIWRECGVADWQRGSPEDTAFDDHNHGIWQGCPHVSSGAADQIDQYEAGCNGLSGWGPDQSPHVKPITWQDAYDKYAGTSGGEGLLGMTKQLNEHLTKDYTVSGDDYKDLKINDDGDYTVASGPVDQISVVANVQIGGLKDGEYFAVRWQIAKFKEGATTTYPNTRPTRRVHGNPKGGIVSVEATYNGGVPKPDSGYSTRLRLGYATDSMTAEVRDVYIEGWRTDD